MVTNVNVFAYIKELLNNRGHLKISVAIPPPFGNGSYWPNLWLHSAPALTSSVSGNSKGAYFPLLGWLLCPLKIFRAIVFQLPDIQQQV